MADRSDHGAGHIHNLLANLDELYAAHDVHERRFLGDELGVRKAIAGAELGCAVAGGISSFFLGGVATEVTQLCNHAQLVAAYALQGTQYQSFLQSMKHLGSRPALSIRSVVQLGDTAMRDINGESAAIGRVVNGQGDNPQVAWASATVPLAGTGYLMSQRPGSVHLSNAASVNMTDAFSADAILAVGDHRQNQLDTTAAIHALEVQAQALDDDSNTPVAQQNITNAAIVHSIKLQQSSAAVNAAILQQLVIANTWRRNAVADRQQLVRSRDRGPLGSDRRLPGAFRDDPHLPDAMTTVQGDPNPSFSGAVLAIPAAAAPGINWLEK